MNHVGDALYGCTPKIGSDFTRTGQLMLTNRIRSRVKDLQDFEFEFRGNDVFSEKRVEETEKIIQKQAAAILSNQKLLLKDVFFSAQAEKEMEENHAREKRERIVDGFVAIVQDIAEQLGMIAGPGNAETGITCIMENRNYSMIVDFTHGKILVENNGHSVNPNHVSANDKTVIPAYNAVMQKFCEYVKTINDTEYPIPEHRLAKEETASGTS